MRLRKLTFALVVAGLFVGAGTGARAQAPQEFVFTSVTGDTSLDGSTITVGVANGADVLLDWDIMIRSTGRPDVFVTPLNSVVNSEAISIYDTSIWLGNFDIATRHLVSPAEHVTGANSAPGGIGDGELGLQPDPQGTWTPILNPVPDAASSLQLFLLAIAALAASRLFFRSRTDILFRESNQIAFDESWKGH